VDANAEMLRTMKREVEARLAKWNAQYDTYQISEGSEFDMMVGDVGVNWGARQVFCLNNELEVRTCGFDVYLEAYREKRLAWQCIAVFE
jgi:hypothetical protein